jgi:hypothetical protein
VHADRGKRLAHFVQLEGFDDGDNELHGQAFISGFRKVASRPNLRPGPIRHGQVSVYKSGIFRCEWHKKFAGPTEKRRETPLYASNVTQTAQILGEGSG